MTGTDGGRETDKDTHWMECSEGHNDIHGNRLERIGDKGRRCQDEMALVAGLRKRVTRSV